jgi:hypothetical protein
VLALGLLVSAPPSAAAQTPAANLPAWRVGVSGGLAAAQHVGALGGVEIARPLSSRLDVIGEGIWVQDTVTRRREETARTVAVFLAQSRSQPAVFTLKAPAGFIGGGARFLLVSPDSRVRPYVVGTAGIARVTLQPSVLVGGSDVTSHLGDYHVTLGSDLAGTSSSPAFGGGIGAAFGGAQWTLDVSLRVTSIKSKDDRANTVKRLAVGISRGF